MDEMVAWLRAQIDEDERRAQRAGDDLVERLRRQAEEVARLYGDPDPPESAIRPADRLWFTAQDAADHIARHDPVRVLREVAAKRAIVNACVEAGREEHADDLLDVGIFYGLRMAVRHLAAGYADRPGYREEWAA